MPSQEPEKGDKVSWNWGGGAPGGTVAEKKTEGEVAITSKRGNKIKKNAEPSDPAVAIERSGNDVVKKASELNVEKKKKNNNNNKTSSGGEKRKKDDGEGKEQNGDAGPMTENEEGKEVRAGGKKAKKEKEEETGAKKAKGRPKGSARKEGKARATEGVSSRTRSRAKV